MKRSAEKHRSVVNSKRQRKLSKSLEASAALSSPQSSKLDLLAHIAELYSDKDEVVPVPPPSTPRKVASVDKKASIGHKKTGSIRGVKSSRKDRKNTKSAKSAKKGGGAKASAAVIHSNEILPEIPARAHVTATQIKKQGTADVMPEKLVGTTKVTVPQVSPSSSVASEDCHSITSRDTPLSRPTPEVPLVVSASAEEVGQNADKKALAHGLLVGMHDSVQQELHLRYQQAQQQQQHQFQQTLLLSALMEQQQRENIAAAPVAMSSQEFFLQTLVSEEQKRQSLHATLREHLLQSGAISQSFPPVELAELLGAAAPTSSFYHFISGQPTRHPAG